MNDRNENTDYQRDGDRVLSLHTLGYKQAYISYTYNRNKRDNTML